MNELAESLPYNALARGASDEIQRDGCLAPDRPACQADWHVGGPYFYAPTVTNTEKEAADEGIGKTIRL